MENKAAAPRRRRFRLPRPRIGRLIRRVSGSPLLVLILVVAVGLAVYFFTKYQDAQEKLKNPEIVAKAETEVLVEQLGKLAVLPVDETPTVATVSDVSKLSGQTFFANAQNGDKVLIYSKAKKAFLYRVKENKIINIAPLNVNNPQ